MKNISKIQILRYAVLTVFLIIVTVAAYRHQILGGGPGGVASIHAICPFGGLEALYKYIAGGEYLKRTNISNFILLGGTMILALLLGRIFCGWICMFGWIQELPARLGKWIFKKRFTSSFSHRQTVKIPEVYRTLCSLIFYLENGRPGHQPL